MITIFCCTGIETNSCVSAFFLDNVPVRSYVPGEPTLFLSTTFPFSIKYSLSVNGFPLRNSSTLSGLNPSSFLPITIAASTTSVV